MTPAERRLLLEVARRLITHIELEFTHVPNYVPGELTRTLEELRDDVLSDSPVYHAPTTDKGT